MQTGEVIRVLIVDDSALAREALTEAATAPDIRVIATARDPFAAAERIREEEPDVIVLDIEMPRMDGVTFLRHLMRQHPIPTIICSSLSTQGSDAAVAALEAGAVDIITKPGLAMRAFYGEVSERLQSTIRAAAASRVRASGPRLAPARVASAAVERAEQPSALDALARTTDKLVLLGASTGGTEAIQRFLTVLPPDAPAIAIVQHMPPGFTASFAKRLNECCRIEVREATDGARLVNSLALIAPGDHHMVVRRTGGHYEVRLHREAPVNRHRPSVDVLFRSGAEAAGGNVIGVILTGMGEDGAAGMLELRERGATTFGQDEATSVVYGMPREAHRRGAVVRQLPIDDIAPAVLAACVA
jgi:two-component system chemotaxis response regulator CheB